MSHALSALTYPEARTTVEVLVVEDDLADTLKFWTACRIAGFAEAQPRLRQGPDAVQYLRREGPHIDARVPDLIYLDLLRPRVSGLCVLKVIKSTPAFRHVSVVVATDSDDPRFFHAVSTLSVDGIIRKPAKLTDFLKSIEPSFEYWISVISLKAEIAVTVAAPGARPV